MQDLVKSEADQSELISAIQRALPGVEQELIEDVLRALPAAMAEIMVLAGPNEKGRYRFEGRGLFTATLKKVPAMVGHGVAEGVAIPEHYTLRLKPSAAMERAVMAAIK